MLCLGGFSTGVGGFGPGLDLILYCTSLSLLGSFFAQPDNLLDWCEGHTVMVMDLTSP